jgi:hypothetical protein
LAGRVHSRDFGVLDTEKKVMNSRIGRNQAK